MEKQLELVRKSTAEAQKKFDESLKSPEAVKPSRLHPAEVAAEQLVSAFSSDELPAQRPAISILNKLEATEREEVFRTLQEYIQSKQWSLWFTQIVVLQGKEDVANCYFRSRQQDHLVVRMVFHQKSWIVAACEVPETRLARREDETLDQHVTEMVISSKEQGTAYLEGPLVDGLYFIEH